MTKKDLFILLLKIFGLSSILAALSSGLLASLSTAMMYGDFLSIVIIILASLLVIALFVLLVFYAPKIVSLLRLEKGFEEDRIELGQLESSHILKLGTFIIGGLSFINYFPDFISRSIHLFKLSQMRLEYTEIDYLGWMISGISLLVGYLLMTNYSRIARFFLQNNSDENGSLHRHE